MDGPQLSRPPCVGLRLDDRSSPHAREKSLDLADSLCPGTPSDLNVIHLVSPASYTAVIDPLILRRHGHDDRPLHIVSCGAPTPARYLVGQTQTTRRKIVPTRPLRPTRLTAGRRIHGQVLPEKRAMQIELRYSDGRTAT